MLITADPTTEWLQLPVTNAAQLWMSAVQVSTCYRHMMWQTVFPNSFASFLAFIHISEGSFGCVLYNYHTSQFANFWENVPVKLSIFDEVITNSVSTFLIRFVWIMYFLLVILLLHFVSPALTLMQFFKIVDVIDYDQKCECQFCVAFCNIENIWQGLKNSLCFWFPSVP